jgi:ATP-dependent RNA helicase DDX24/MAK5
MKQKRQNFLFSATLVTSFAGEELKKKEKSSLDVLINKIQMTKEPKVVDLTTKQITAETLFQTKIFCSITDKDIYLYYFTSKYTGRTLVFANSIDCVRRLTNLFRLLNKEPLHLHANMNQKQRCKNLEKFNSQPDSLLIASDVAARGLDIPGVMHVIHYQVPRSAEIYIHRSGRTARSMHEGLSVLLVSPDENNLYKKILQTFKNGNFLRLAFFFILNFLNFQKNAS